MQVARLKGMMAFAMAALGAAFPGTARADIAVGADPGGTASASVSADEPVVEVGDPEVVQEIPSGTSDLAERPFDCENAICRDRGINILTARPTKAKSLTLVIDHRPQETFWKGKDAFFNYLGLDSGGLKIGLGLRYGILDDLDAGLYRLSNGADAFDTYEFDARFGFLKQQRHFVDAALRAGVTWFVQRKHGDASGYFGQLFVDRVFFNALLAGVGFAFHSESSNDEKAKRDKAYSGALVGVLEWRILRMLAWTGEISASLLGYGSKWPAFSTGVKLLTHRHAFSLLVSNTQYITADGVVTNSSRDFEQLIFGFQIVRGFDF